MHEQTHEVVAIGGESVEHADAHIVATAFHGAVHGLGMVVVVALGASGMQFLIVLLVIGFLEQDVGANAGSLEFGVVFDSGCSNVDIHAADGAVAHLGVVDGLDRVENIFDGVEHRMLAGFECQTLVPHLLERDNFLTDFVLREFLARYGVVLAVVGAIDAPVDAVVRKVEGCKEHDAVAIEFLLDLACQIFVAFHEVGLVALEQHGGFAVREAFAGGSLVDDFFDKSPVATVLFGVVQGLHDFAVVDKLFGMR